MKEEEVKGLVEASQNNVQSKRRFIEITTQSKGKMLPIRRIPESQAENCFSINKLMENMFWYKTWWWIPEKRHSEPFTNYILCSSLINMLTINKTPLHRFLMLISHMINPQLNFTKIRPISNLTKNFNESSHPPSGFLSKISHGFHS